MIQKVEEKKLQKSIVIEQEESIPFQNQQGI